MKRVLSAVCCLALCSATAFAAPKRSAEGPTMADQQFVDFAAQTDMTEANLGQLAENNAEAQPVKDYGQMLTEDHTKNYNQLFQVAKQANLNVPNAINSEHNKMDIDPLEKLKGHEFDHKFIQTMITGHTKALEIFKKEANDAQNPALKDYAQQTIPVLQKHLDDAKGLEKAHTK